MRRTLPRAFPHKNLGLSLVELMIALVLGLLLVGGAIGIFLGTRQAIRTSENVVRVQENTRFTFETLARELRAAGGTLCGSPQTNNVIVNANTTWWANWAEGPVRGFTGTENSSIKPFGAATGDRVNGTDAILIRSASLGTGYTVRAHDQVSTEFTVNAPNEIRVGDALMACNQDSAAIFHATTVSPDGSRIQHAAGVENTTASLCVLPPCFVGGMIAKLTSTFWYVGRNARGGRSLYRMAVEGNPNPRVDEIAADVQNLSIRFLVRNGNVAAQDFSSASDIINWNDAVSPVVAVRLEADLQSAEAVGADNQPITRKFYAVVGLRNKDVVQ